MTYDRYVELTEYLTVVGEESDKKRGYKFPLTTCDMLCADGSNSDEFFLPLSGTVLAEEKIIKSVEKEVEQEIDEDDDEEEVQSEEVKKPEEGAVVEGEEKPKEKGEGEDEEFGEFVAAPIKKKKVVLVKEVVDEV
jgi:hypothetical protein